VQSVASTRTERIPAAGDGELDVYIWSPNGGKGPGILLLQEIFGVGSYLRAVAERLCDLGYTVLAPDLFWRIERNVALEHDEQGLNRGYELIGQFDFELGLADCEASLAHLRALPETDGRAGVLGFCLGGRMAYSVAARYAPDVAVSYYGSGIADALDEADGLRCPIVFHFGKDDGFIPIEQVDVIKETIGSRENIEIHVYDAGHAFDNHESAMFYVESAAADAWTITTAFLAAEFAP